MKRRDFLTLVAVSAGSTYAAMMALDLLAKPVKAKEPVQLRGESNGKKILILGAGITGMAAAYELSKVGYHCTIVEARDRSGGRCWTVRQGTSETEIDGERQIANFAEGLYFNAGPTRISQHHITLDYCRELGVPIEVFTQTNDAAYYYNEDVGTLSGKRVPIRAAKADLRGYMTELLAKAINQDALDLELSVEDQEKLIEFLKVEGDLSPDLFYKKSNRRGYSILPGAGLESGTINEPFDLQALIESGFGQYFRAESLLNYQMTLFQPVGGMDNLAKAFEQRVKDKIIYQAIVQEIRKTPQGVRVIYQDHFGKQKAIEGDFCICTFPLSILKSIPGDFSPQMQNAIRQIPYLATGKIGLQFQRRFWEEDENIFGGITYTNLDITQIFYPSSGYLSNKGLLVGYYNYLEIAEKIGNLSLTERQALALAQGSKIHPQYQQEFETSFSVAWQKVPYSLGSWAIYTSELRQQFYAQLNKPDDRIYLAGDHLSYYVGWLAGALESARKVVKDIHHDRTQTN